MDSEDTFLCHQCGKIFYKLSTLESHVKWKHMDKTNEFMCDQCGRTFQKKYNLIKHLDSGIHDVSETVNCAVCDFRALNRKLMVLHYQNFHGVILKESNVYFKTAEQFHSWKSEFENKTKSRYVKMSSSRKRKNGFIRSTYFCHRDGNFISKGRNLRHLKLKGSNKINAHCPAKMDVDINERIVIVSYIDKHLGHELDISRMYLDHTDKALIARKLALKVPFEKILDEINSSVQECELKRVNLLTRKDLWNIVDTFKIDPKSVVYSKTRMRRKKKMDRPKKEPKKSHAYLKVLNQDQNSSDDNRIVQNVDEGQDDTGNRIILDNHEEKNVIVYPIIFKNENNEYIQQYAVLSDENEEDAGTCLFLNSQGELESISGHNVVYTEEGDLEISESTADDDEVYSLNGDEQLFSAQAMSTGFNETGILNVKEQQKRNGCKNVLMNDSALPVQEFQMKKKKIFDIQAAPEGGNPSIHLLTDITNNSKLMANEEMFININKVTEFMNSRRKTDMKLVEVKQEMEDPEIFCIKTNNISETSVPCQFSQNPVEEMIIDGHTGYEVVVDFEEQEVNEYVIISSEEELNECLINASDNDPKHILDDSPLTSENIFVREEDDDAQTDNEDADDPHVEAEVFEVEAEPEWNKKRKKVLHKLLNMHNMINNKHQLHAFSKNISSLENVIKSLSKND